MDKLDSVQILLLNFILGVLVTQAGISTITWLHDLRPGTGYIFFIIVSLLFLGMLLFWLRRKIEIFE